MSFRRGPMKLCAVAVASMPLSPAVAADYLGNVTAVADGDTFTMESKTGKVHVRICGIDAPERGQTGYGQAAGVLSEHDRKVDIAATGGGVNWRIQVQPCCEPIPLSGPTKSELLNSLIYRELPKNSKSKNQRIVS